ncbi:MAG: MerR family transcriptional regulator [Candidatus Sumerlaeia bacterium]
MSDKIHTIEIAAARTGLDASEIRFFRNQFSDFFPHASRNAVFPLFNNDELETLRLINEMVFQCEFSLDEVHAELLACDAQEDKSEESLAAMALAYKETVIA